jgi:hypothetical protein
MQTTELLRNGITMLLHSLHHHGARLLQRRTGLFPHIGKKKCCARTVEKFSASVEA